MADTRYIVFEASGALWEAMELVEAPSGKVAIRKAAEGLAKRGDAFDSSGSFAAVPERSWTTARVQAVQQTRIVLDGLEAAPAEPAAEAPKGDSKGALHKVAGDDAA